MTHSAEAERLIAEHLAWLRPRTRTAVEPPQEPPTIVSRRRALRHADRHLPYGLLRADELEWVAYLSQWDGWSRYTYDTHARSFYTWAVRYGRLTLNPLAELPKPQPPKEEPRYVHDFEIAAALAAPEPYGRAMWLAAYMGLRCGEIARAERGHVRGDKLWVRGKGGKSRLVPIAPEVAPLIYGATGRLLGRTIRETSLSQQQRPVWQALGLGEDFSLHSGRHWYATRLLETGATLVEVQRLLGHASVATTMVYLAVVDSRKSAAVARLPKLGALGPAAIRPEALEHAA